MRGKKYPEGHFIGMWMFIGVVVFSGIGIPLSILTENFSLVGIGPAIGIAFGLSIGAGVEEKIRNEGRIRHLNKKETETRKIGVIIGVILLLIGIETFLLLYFLG